MNKEDYILKSKITEILGLEDDSNEEVILTLIETIVDENNRLEDIEDRKVQIEYNNVFNKGVKSVEDKIKEKLKEYKRLEETAKNQDNIEYTERFNKIYLYTRIIWLLQELLKGE